MNMIAASLAPSSIPADWEQLCGFTVNPQKSVSQALTMACSTGASADVAISSSKPDGSTPYFTLTGTGTTNAGVSLVAIPDQIWVKDTAGSFPIVSIISRI